MTRDEFWSLVGKIHNYCRGDFDQKCSMLESELLVLPLEEVQAFDSHFRECREQAYTWRLWAAAYVYSGGGCSNDGFLDFRSELVSTGKELFERVLKDPETLIEMPWFVGAEGYQYIAGKVWSQRSDKEMPRSPLTTKREPLGERWEESDLPRMFPKLAKHCKFE